MLKSLKPLVQISFYLLIWMSWLRIVLFLYTIFPESGIPTDLAMSLFAGLRFDLLVLGFIWIPIWFSYWIFYLLGRVSQISGLFKFYWVLVILITTSLAVIDFYWFTAKYLRMNYEVLSSDGFWIIAEQAANTKYLTALPLIILPALALLIYTILKFYLVDYSEKPTKVILNLIFSFLIVASAARGTWTAHHLEWQDSQVSDTQSLNELALNPLWNLDKAKR